MQHFSTNSLYSLSCWRKKIIMHAISNWFWQCIPVSSMTSQSLTQERWHGGYFDPTRIHFSAAGIFLVITTRQFTYLLPHSSSYLRHHWHFLELQVLECNYYKLVLEMCSCFPSGPVSPPRHHFRWNYERVSSMSSAQ